MRGKKTKTREELAAEVMAQVRERPCRKVAGVVIAPVLKRFPDHPNWHAAFTMKERAPVPHIAWIIGNQIADQFDLAPEKAEPEGAIRTTGRPKQRAPGRLRTTNHH